MHYLELKIILQHIKNRCMYMATRHNSNPITHSSKMSVLLLHIFRLQTAAKVSHRSKVFIYSYFEIPHIHLQFQKSFQPPKGLVRFMYLYGRGEGGVEIQGVVLDFLFIFYISFLFIFATALVQKTHMMFPLDCFQSLTFSSLEFIYHKLP